MATLVRVKSDQESISGNQFLHSTIPSPFPREQLQNEARHAPAPPPLAVIVPEVVIGSSHAVQLPQEESLYELNPSIAYVERSCLMTLNNLLSVPTRWNPILPDRRHSMPTSPGTSPEMDPQSSSALQTLVSNLRNQHHGDQMVQVAYGKTDSELIQELSIRVQELSSLLDFDDAELAQTLVSLISHFNRLSIIQNTPSTFQSRMTSAQSMQLEQSAAGDIFGTLTRQLSDFQVERTLSQQTMPSTSDAQPVVAVESALLWARIDEELEHIVSICQSRTTRRTEESLPPQYDPADYNIDALPEYEAGRLSIDSSKHPHQSSHQPLSATSEKMRLDLEAVTMAIDRLYLVAPQLHNQRVELKSSKVAEMERARVKGATARGKEKAKDPADLEHMFMLIGKASERTLKDQSVIIEGGMAARLERARQRDQAKRAAFVEQLAEHSNAGRFHGQDAVLTPPRERVKDPKAMLTLPEFIREAVPVDNIRQDPRAMLTLPEFVNEPPPTAVSASPSSPPATMSRIKSLKSRSRSMSAPAMSWFRSPRSAWDLKRSAGEQQKEEIAPSKLPFDVYYLAENHDNLQHILVFFSVTGATPGVDLEAEVLPSVSDDSTPAGDRLIIKSGANTSLPLILPGRVAPGKKEIKVQSSHYEIKFSTLPTESPTSTSGAEPLPLLDATQLSTNRPTSFICASCSLPLVQSAKVTNYKDLPSEHWEELVDTWMCHTDQKLHAQAMKHGKAGFWPQPGQALVGGSYILFEQSAMTKNIHPDHKAKRGDDWLLSRCLCGAVIGRSREHVVSIDETDSLVYRLLKYAIRPVSPTAEPTKIPLSAFVVEDMKEFVQAHATHRFVIQDEEDERPRILIWLFKSSMQLSYAAQTQYAIPKHGSITAAKVLYKLLGPSEGSTDLTSILSRYPGFPQAEYLFYPMNICRQIASLLKESNRSYPETLRTLTGLEVGWLRRA